MNENEKRLQYEKDQLMLAQYLDNQNVKLSINEYSKQKQLEKVLYHSSINEKGFNDLNIYLWLLLWHKDVKLHLKIPDTIIFNNNKFVQCLFTSKTGLIKSNFRLNQYNDDLYQRLKKKYENVENYQNFMVIYEENDENVLLLNCLELKRLLLEFQELSKPSESLEESKESNMSQYYRKKPLKEFTKETSTVSTSTVSQYCRISAYIHPFANVKYVVHYKKYLKSDYIQNPLLKKKYHLQFEVEQFNPFNTDEENSPELIDIKNVNIKTIIECKKISLMLIDYINEYYQQQITSNGIISLTIEYSRDYDFKLFLLGFKNVYLSASASKFQQKGLDGDGDGDGFLEQEQQEEQEEQDQEDQEEERKTKTPSKPPNHIPPPPQQQTSSLRQHHRKFIVQKKKKKKKKKKKILRADQIVYENSITQIEILKIKLHNIQQIVN